LAPIPKLNLGFQNFMRFVAEGNSIRANSWSQFLKSIPIHSGMTLAFHR
jgi:hypothetical protein